MILPKYAAVANAIGAVVGWATMRKSGVVTTLSESCYQLHFKTRPKGLVNPKNAMEWLEEALRKEVTK